jgi:protoporphyrin/coproporphyrin ferrochelatase
MMPNNQSAVRIGVVLFQLGGPDSPEAVEPFLYNLFSDPDIIDFPLARLAREPLARLISSRRARAVREHYAEIGGKSPIGELTARQAAALEAELRKSHDARVFVAMRYWHPMTHEVVEAVHAHALSHLVLLPLYPQYSKTTTGSSLNEWNRLYRNGATPISLIPDYHDDPAYIDSVVAKVNDALARFRAPLTPNNIGAIHELPLREPSTNDVHLVFSAHGVPLSSIEHGDPYQRQIEATVRLVRARGGFPNPWRLCYQSRSGPGRWLRPFLEETLDDLSRQPEGSRRVLVIPIAFVSDHVETLHEIDIDARAHARRIGIEQFEVMPALNDSPQFIRALAQLVLRETVRVRT